MVRPLLMLAFHAAIVLWFLRPFRRLFIPLLLVAWVAWGIWSIVFENTVRQAAAQRLRALGIGAHNARIGGNAAGAQAGGAANGVQANAPYTTDVVRVATRVPTTDESMGINNRLRVLANYLLEVGPHFGKVLISPGEEMELAESPPLGPLGPTTILTRLENQKTYSSLGSFGLDIRHYSRVVET